MSDYNKNYFYNPSALYLEARKSKDFLDTARKTCGDFLNATKDSIVFTGSGTESNNLFKLCSSFFTIIASAIVGLFIYLKAPCFHEPKFMRSQNQAFVA
jgi:hypothetical protein